MKTKKLLKGFEVWEIDLKQVLFYVAGFYLGLMSNIQFTDKYGVLVGILLFILMFVCAAVIQVALLATAGSKFLDKRGITGKLSIKLSEFV